MKNIDFLKVLLLLPFKPWLTLIVVNWLLANLSAVIFFMLGMPMWCILLVVILLPWAGIASYAITTGNKVEIHLSIGKPSMVNFLLGFTKKGEKGS